MRQSPPVPTISNASSSIRRFISQKTPRVRLRNLAALGTRRRQRLETRKHPTNFEDSADPRYIGPIRLHQALHEHQAAGGAQNLRLALHPRTQGRGAKVIDLQIDGGQEAAVKVIAQYHRRHRQQHVAKRRHHAAVANLHRVAVARLNAKSHLHSSFRAAGVERAVRVDEPVAKETRLEASGYIESIECLESSRLISLHSGHYTVNSVLWNKYEG